VSEDGAEETAESCSVEQEKCTADRWAREGVILERFLRLKIFPKCSQFNHEPPKACFPPIPESNPLWEMDTVHLLNLTAIREGL